MPDPNPGIDTVVLAEGHACLVYSPATDGKQEWGDRGTLGVAVTADGSHWKQILTLKNSPGCDVFLLGDEPGNGWPGAYPLYMQTFADNSWGDRSGAAVGAA